MLVRFSQWWGSHAGEVLCWWSSHTAGEVLILVKFSLRWWGSHASEVLTVVRFSCGWGSLLVRFSHCWWDSHSAGEVLSLLARLSCWWGFHTAGKVLTSLVTFSHCGWGSHTDGEVLTLMVASALYNFIRGLKKTSLLLSGSLIFNIILVTFLIHAPVQTTKYFMMKPKGFIFSRRKNVYITAAEKRWLLQC